MSSPKNPKLVDEIVGRNIILRRKSLKMSQTDLGDKLGVTFQQIQKYERGTNRVSASRLWILSEIFDVDISYFFEGVAEFQAAGNSMDEEASLKTFLSDPLGVKIANAFSKIEDANIKSDIVQLIETISKSSLSSSSD